VKERYLPILATVTVFVLLYLIGALLYRNFLSTLALGDLLTDNAFVIIAAVGATFVILSGGIDISIGSMIGLPRRDHGVSATGGIRSQPLR